uniref:Uncharacterized protein n=1 Tax=Anguilla anguilla TaxID=7936 RepID=A0A0E9QD06_ANGAN
MSRGLTGVSYVSPKNGSKKGLYRQNQIALPCSVAILGPPRPSICHQEGRDL